MIRQCYVSGPYSGDTRTRVLQNISKALVAACQLTERGFHVIVPHVCGSHRVDWDTALEHDRALIRGLDPTKDRLVLLPGWEESRGAREEWELALQLGLPVWTLGHVLGTEGAE